MPTSRRVRLTSCPLTVLLLLGLSPLPSRSQEPSQPTSQVSTSDIDAKLEQAREYIKNAQYGPAVDLLKPTIDELRDHVEKLREAYLLLIKTYEIWGNDERRGPNGMTGAEPYYKEARQLISNCLSVRELRHTRPDSESDYPVEMINDFNIVRAELFGSFRVSSLEPAGALVILDADTLAIAAGDSLPGDVDILAGRHLVVVRAPGYNDLTDDITIPNGGVFEKPYELRKKRGKRWYLFRGTPVAAAMGVGVALIAGKDKKATQTEEPLPGPPGPPSR